MYRVHVAKPWRTAAAAAYVIALVAVAIFLGIALVPDRLVIGFLPVVLVVGRFRAFVRDWLPFLVVLFGYEYLRGFGGHLIAQVHFTTMLRFDQGLFGVVPTQYLQNRFFTPTHLHWYDYLATLFDFMHFVVPMLFGLYLWFKAPARFSRFAFALLLLSLLALATYLGFPAAPPWLAGEDGYLPGVASVLSHTLQSFPTRLQLPTIYSEFDPDVVAAVPSLHAGYACLVALFLGRTFGRRGSALGMAYAAAMGLSLVYLGEHYVGDVIAGFLYAITAFTVTCLFLDGSWSWRLHGQPATMAIAGPARSNVPKPQSGR